MSYLEHLEDNISQQRILQGPRSNRLSTVLHEMLEGNAKDPYPMTTKWDGAPLLLVEIPTGKFFVGTKGVFAKSPKMNFTDKDIDENHSRRIK